MGSRRSAGGKTSAELRHGPEADARTSASDPSSGSLLHLGLLGLLLLEVWVVRGRFDTDRFEGDPRGWAQLLFASRYAAPLGIAVVGAWILVGGRTLREEYSRLRQVCLPRSRLQRGALAHLTCFAGFYWLTGFLFERLDASRGMAGALAFLAWLLAALAVPASAALSAFRGEDLGRSCRRLLPSLAVAFLVGSTAYAASRWLLASGLWFPLAVWTTRLARLFLTGVGETSPPTEDEPLILVAGDFRVLITRQCSGYEGIGLVWTFLAAYLVWFRHTLRFPHALGLIPLATLVVWVANAFRLAALVWIGGRVSTEVALQGFHSYAGWIIFCSLSLTIVFLSSHSRWLTRDMPSSRAAGVNPVAVYLAPFMAILAVSFLTGALSAGFDRLYPLRIVAGGFFLWRSRTEIPERWWCFSRNAVAMGALAFALWAGLAALGVQSRGASTAGTELASMPLALATLWAVFRTVGFLIVAPLAEELAFRGYLARRFVQQDFEAVPFSRLPLVTLVLSALAFGLLHGQWIAGTLTGLVFGLALRRRGRLGDAVMAHALTNALLLLQSLLSGSWHAWM